MLKHLPSLPVTPVYTKRFWTNLPRRLNEKLAFYRSLNLDQAGGNLLLYFGHHKCASSYVKRIVMSFGRRLGVRYASFVAPDQYQFDIDSYIRLHKPKLLLFQNADPLHLPKDFPFVGFHVIRDPRDIVVSSYHSHRNSHLVDGWPELIEHRKRLQSLSLEEGLFAEMEFSGRLPTRGIDLDLMRTIGTWNYADPRICEVRFEEVTRQSVETFTKIFQFVLDRELAADLGDAYRAHLLELDAATMAQNFIDEFNFEKMSGGRKLGKVNNKSHYRSGKSDQWREVFTDAHKQRFKEMFGDVVVRAGYAASNDW